MRKAIEQYNLSGKLIKVWKSIAAAARYSKIHRASISSCLYGKCRTSGGYIWKYHKKIN